MKRGVGITTLNYKYIKMHTKNLSILTILVTFLLLILGGFVHNTGSSLACPDWPLCYGEVFPKMEGGILIEHGHRLLASFVGLLTIFLVFTSYKTKKAKPHLFNMCCLALFLVITQGMLGGITVYYRLPTIVSTSHLALSLFYFSLLIYIFHLASRIEVNFSKSETIKKEWNPNLRYFSLIVGIITYAQIILGAFVRHAGAGASCGIGPKNILKCLDGESWVSTWAPSFPPSSLHMFHRYMAMFVGVLVIGLTIKMILNFRSLPNFSLRKSVIRTSLFASFAVLFQIILGFITVSTALGTIPTTLHLGGAALLLGLLYFLYLKIIWIEKNLFEKRVNSTIGDYIELTKPRLSGLVMVTVLAGILMAPGEVSFFKSLYAMILMSMLVAGGTTLNCYIEKDVDGLMDRTKGRALPAGRMKPKSALVFGIILTIFSLVALFILVNPLTALLAFMASALYLFAYTPMKQKSAFAVVVGAIPGAIPPLMGWASVTGELTSPLAWFLFAVLFFWQIPHFMAISICYADDYNAAGIKVYPNESGFEKTRLGIILLTALLFVACYLPVTSQALSVNYWRAAIFFNSVFLLLALKGLFINTDLDSKKAWAKKYFWGSIFYLPLLLGSALFLH